MASIAVKIDEAAHNDHGPLNGFLAGIDGVPEEAWGSRRTTDEMEEGWRLAYFGFYVGMAYALARLEEPWASEEAWVKTAAEAAVKAHRWGDTIGGRQDGEC